MPRKDTPPPAATAILLVLALGGPARAQTEGALAPPAPDRPLAELAAPEAPQALSRPLAELERRLDLLSQEVEKARLGEAADEPLPPGTSGSLGPAASRVYRRKGGLSIAGYGEVLYENFASAREDGSSSGLNPKLDALRLVLYVGHKWDDRTLFNSEIEFEHGSTGKGGEASVEFAYIERRLAPPLSLRAGMLLVPVGLVNEMHEPPTFLGAKRTDVESGLIPTTWRENGLGVAGEAGPVSWRAYLINGLDASASGNFSSSGIRGARQKGANAKARDMAWVGRADLAPFAGTTLGGSLYVGNSGQGKTDAQGTIGARLTLWEAHASWRRRGLEVRGLFASASVGDAARLNALFGQKVAERLQGWYLEAGWDVLTLLPSGERSSLSPFYRYEKLDTQASMPSGTARDASKDQTIQTLGLAFRPIPETVVKAEFQDRSNAAGTGVDQMNLVVGWLF